MIFLPASDFFIFFYASSLISANRLSLKGFQILTYSRALLRGRDSVLILEMKGQGTKKFTQGHKVCSAIENY